MAHRAAKTAKDVYRGYMPIDLPQHRPRRRFKPWWKVLGKPRETLYPEEVSEEVYSEQPQYPPLNDGSRKGVKTQIRLDWYNSLEKLPTVDAKLYEIGRHCNHYIAHINNWMYNYDSLPIIQYLTQTKVIDQLPESYRIKPEGDASDPKLDLIDKVRKLVLNQIFLDKFGTSKNSPYYVSKVIRDGNREAHVSNQFVQNLISSVKNMLVLEENPQLSNYQYDLSPAIRSWWYHSGLDPPNNKVFFKSRKDENGKINQMIQMDGSSSLNIRDSNFIEPILEQTDPQVTVKWQGDGSSPSLKYYGAHYKFKNPIALPGFWFEDVPKYDCPHTSFLSTDCLRLRRECKNYKVVKDLDDVDNCLNGQAVLTAFSWLNSLAIYHGYTPFQELDYPFTCQLVTTDGQNWLFNVYQLNCHTFHRDLGGPSKNNICWTSGVMRLYEDFQHGDFTNVNDDVVRLLVRFLSQKTSEEYTSSLNMRPHLGDDLRTEEEKAEVMTKLRRIVEGRSNTWLKHQWKVPLFEHLWFRSKASRNRITHMKPQWHIPKPKYPKIFE